MRVCLGGTFEPFHAGHKALLRAAAAGATELFVGITDGNLALRPERKIVPWQERAHQVEAYMASIGFRGLLVTRALTDPYGPAASDAYDAIAASPETLAGAASINKLRSTKGLAPLIVRLVPHVLGQDFLPVSGTRIHAGDIDADGRRLRPLRVSVGSANAVKVAAVKQEFARLIPCPLEVRGHAVKSRVPEQPKKDQTLRGARARAAAARQAWPTCDYAVGIEAGLVKFPGEDAFLEAQACSIVDRDGWETHGWGPAFHYPEWVTKRALAGEMVSTILGPVANDPRIGSTTGAIGFLSDGRLDRTGLTQSAVLMAFLPRIRREMYRGPEPVGQQKSRAQTGLRQPGRRANSSKAVGQRRKSAASPGARTRR